MTVKESVPKLTLQQRHGRALNAVAELLRKRLSVPNIYLEPPSNLVSADLLAVDRGGAGDLHAVEIKLGELDPIGVERFRSSNPKGSDQLVWLEKFSSKLNRIHQRLMSMSAHYRYLALPVKSFDIALGELGRFGLFPKDGIGRLGIITITERENESPSAELAVIPERFRMDSLKLKAIETKLLDKSRPDIEVRL